LIVSDEDQDPPCNDDTDCMANEIEVASASSAVSVVSGRVFRTVLVAIGTVLLVRIV
jgi:hypothetical protein